MSLHNVGQAKDEITALLQGQNLARISNVNGALERAARTTVQQADVPEASGMEAITLYGGVSYYTAPSTIFGGALNLIRRQGDASTPWDYNYKVAIDDFTRAKHNLPNGYMIDFEYRNGAGIMGIATPNTYPKVILDPMNEIGNWVAGGSASGLAQDITNYYEQPASLRFTLTGSSTGTLTETLSNPLDMSGYTSVGVAFLAIEIPAGVSASALTSISLKLGSTASDYYEVAATQGFLGAWTANNWLLVKFDYGTSGVTTTGTPDWSNLDYIQVTMNHTATMVNFRLGGLFMSLPVPHELLFQSSAIFLASGSSTPSQSITTDGDTIMLNDAAYNLFLYESVITIATQQGGTLESGFIQTMRANLFGSGNDMGLYAHYRADNPSQELRTIGEWYSAGDSGRYNRY